VVLKKDFGCSAVWLPLQRKVWCLFMLSLLSVYVFDGMPGLYVAFSTLFWLAVYVFDLSHVNND
jgi:hypothetical protein